MREAHARIRRAISASGPRRAAFVLSAALGAIALASCGGAAPSGAPRAGSTAPVEPSARLGDLVLRASAVPTASLNAAVARQYGIAIDDTSVMVLVSVRRGPDDRETAVAAHVDASAIDLLGKRQTIVLREIRSGEFVDYVGVADVIMPDTLRFDVAATATSGERLQLQFNRDFFAR